MQFWLGTHETAWLGRAEFPLFVSHTRLARRKRLPVATCDWALDSGGFTELDRHGRWDVTAAQYVTAVRRYHDEIGRLAWAAPQDWMCEPVMLAKTGYTVADHQMLTVHNFLDLRELAGDLPIIPVLQGWTLADYLRCVDRYAANGIDLTAEPLVGIGSVCRRQDTTEIDVIVSAIAGLGIRLHGFGVKTRGLAKYAPSLVSADSLAWSYNARKNAPLDGCTHKSCANCLLWASRWRDDLLAALNVPCQLAFGLEAA